MNKKDLLTIPLEQIRDAIGQTNVKVPLSEPRRAKFYPTQPRQPQRPQRVAVNLERITGQITRAKKGK